MRARELVAQAAAALAAHRLRATLSSLGIVVGVATVVTALAIGEGARREAVAELGALGIDNVFARARAREVPGPYRMPLAPALTRRDADEVARAVRSAVAVAAVRSAPAEMDARGRRADGTLVGVTPAWLSIAGRTVSRGRWIDRDDDRARRRVAVIGAALARRVFAGADPVGRTVRAAGEWYRIVGVLGGDAADPARRPAIQRVDPAEALLVPIGAMDVSLGMGDTVDRVQEIAIRAAGADQVARAAADVARVLAREHPGEPVFDLVVPRELLEARLRAERTFGIVLVAIGGLALVISGVGIMNIMLASVAERTAEIGVRRAFGAKQREIVAQFALEAALLCLAGAAMGLPLGAALSAAVAVAAGWPVAVSAGSIVLAVALAVATGFVFGIYPARQAARLDPAVALRAE